MIHLKRLVIFLAFMSSTVQSQGRLVEADGKIFFKNNQGVIEKFDAALNVPRKGEGEITLRVGDKIYSTPNFSIRKRSGRTILYVVFEKNKQLFGHSKKVVFKGTYVRGSNLAVYYGDFFTPVHKKMKKDGPHKREYRYLGGFAFKKILEAQALL